MLVSKHRAPVGALRQLGLGLVRERGEVSKHRAPVGALRPEERGVGGVVLAAVSKHRAPVGALRQIVNGGAVDDDGASASTAHL